MDLHKITFEARGASFTGHLADGSHGRAVPGILVAHESGGLDANTLLRTRMLGELGYVALAVDLFGEAPGDLERMRAHTRALVANRPLLREIMGAGLGVLAEHPSVDRSKLGAIGFCFGGFAALELARTGADLRCIVGFHSGLFPGNPEEANSIRAKVLICLGAADPVVGADQREAFAAEMSAAGTDWQLILYGGVGHSFTNRGIDAYDMPGFAYDEMADRRSWQAMRALFDETFGPSGDSG